MLTILSPSKTQDFSGSVPEAVENTFTEPVLLAESAKLVEELRSYSIDAMARLMGVSENLATLAYNRYQHFSLPFTKDNARQALLAFRGDVYTDIAVDEYTAEDFAFAQQHLCILSGLYGLLRPLDLIQPYRLEMKTPLKNSRGKDLYQFWNGRLTAQLNQWLEGQADRELVNLASQEYFRALHPKKIQGALITPVFREQKGNTYRTVAIHAKRARGMMANFIVRHRIDEAEHLKAFTEAGYRYSDELSSTQEWVFIR